MTTLLEKAAKILGEDIVSDNDYQYIVAGGTLGNATRIEVWEIPAESSRNGRAYLEISIGGRQHVSERTRSKVERIAGMLAPLGCAVEVYLPR